MSAGDHGFFHPNRFKAKVLILDLPQRQLV
jgi:hypothetical protein